MASITRRESIRWASNEPSEPTSTLVLTSPQQRFIDIRILKPRSADEDESPICAPLSRLDWAFAGTSTSDRVPWLAPPQQCTQPPRRDTMALAQWRHEIDSRAPPFQDEHVVDRGTNYALDDSGTRTLEIGQMVNPDTGREEVYEEIWREERLNGEEQVACQVWELNGGKEMKGLVVRAAGWCQGIIKVICHGPDNEELEVKLSVERWKEDKDGQWMRIAKLGDAFLPCSICWTDTGHRRVGDTVRYGDQEWRLVEMA